MSMSSLLQVAVLATGFASTALAQSWMLPVPGSAAEFSGGDVVPLLWSTPYAYTNIELWQGPQADGAYQYTTLVNASISENSYKWTAGTLASASLDRQAFFFRLRNAQEEGGAYVDSSDILVLPAAAAASITGIKTSTAAPTSTGTGAATTSTGASTGASTMVTSTSSSASSSGASSSSASAATAAVTNPAGGAAAAGAGADTAKDPYKGIDYTSSFIGVGVGLGVPALLAALAAAFLMIRKRKAAKNPTEPEMQQQQAPAAATA